VRYVLAIIGVLLVCAAIVGGCYAKYGPSGTVTFTVQDKIVKASHGNDQKYLILTDHGPYEDTDRLLLGKTNSTDLYAQLRVGHRYTCSYRGSRVSLFSWYRDLMSCAPAR